METPKQCSSVASSWGRVACAHVQPATVKAHALCALPDFPTSGFRRSLRVDIGATDEPTAKIVGRWPIKSLHHVPHAANQTVVRGTGDPFHDHSTLGLENSPGRGWNRGTHRCYFSRIYRTEKPRLIRYFRRNLGNKANANEMAQKALIDLLRWGAPGTTNPGSYLTRIAYSLVKDRSVRKALRLFSANMPSTSSAFNVHRDPEARKALLQLQDALSP